MRLININDGIFEIALVKICVEFLLKNGGSDIPFGRHDISDSDIYVNVFEYDTKTFEQSSWEAHKEYADLQIILSGCEKIMVAGIADMKLGDYHPDDDYQECEGMPEHTIEIGTSLGLLLMPEDAHMPGVCFGEKTTHVKKCVFKIPVKYF